jgi:sugar lactone lactonase YvrE
MKSTNVFATVLAALVGVAVWSQQPAPRTSGPGVQNTKDSRYADVIKNCKTPPPARGGGPPRAGAGKDGKAPQGKDGKAQAKGAAAAGPRDYTVTAIPGVIAAGAQWKEVWTGTGNNADGIVGTKDGGILIAQNDNSDVLKLDKNGKTSVAYSGLNTSGSVAMSSKGAIFVVNRGLNPSVEQLAPVRKPLATKYNDDPLDCLGTVMNDIVADSKGGVYFTMGTVYHSDASGKVTKYGDGLNTNGIMLSPDEKHLFVTNGGSLVEFDVNKDGSLANQREFAKYEGGGGDGSTFDSMGRMYVTSTVGIQVISTDGKVLGVIPAPRGLITVAFSGPDRKTLYGVANNQANDFIMTIPMIAQGAKGRGK